MNYFVLNENKMFHKEVAVFDSVNSFCLGIMLKHHLGAKLLGIASKDDDKFNVFIVKVKKKEFDKFQEAMKDLDSINKKFYGEEYITFCDTTNKQLHYERYAKENEIDS